MDKDKYYQVLKTVPMRTIEKVIAKALSDEAGIEYEVEVSDIEYLDTYSFNKAQITIVLDKQKKSQEPFRL